MSTTPNPDSERSEPPQGTSTGPPSEDQRTLEDQDLQDSLAALSRLGSNRMSLEALLTQVASYAVRAIPGADGAGLTLLEERRPDTIVASASFVREIDDIQYGVGQGPCITAAREGRTVMSGSLGGDHRWPKFGGRIARLGVHSVLSLPLIAPDGVVGAMNVYAHAKNVFDERAAELGEYFAVPAAIAVQNAQVLAQTQRLAARLQADGPLQAKALHRASGTDRFGLVELTQSRATDAQWEEQLRIVASASRILIPVHRALS